MKKISRLLALTYLMVLASCSTDPNPLPPQPTSNISYLTIIVESNYNTNTIPSEDWILVHRENGDLFNYVPLQNGNTVVLETLATENLANMTVTSLRVNDFGTKKSYHLQSYGKLQPGRIWTLKGYGPPSAPLTELGQANITVNNVPSWNTYTLTNTMDDSPSELSAYMANNPGFDPNTVAINNFSYKQSSDYLMTVIDGNWTPTYHWINGMTDGANITLDGSTGFSAFDQLANIPLDNSVNNFNYNVSAENATTNSRFQLYWASTANPNYIAGTNTSLEIGYLNAYQDYETNLFMGNDNLSYSYTKKGSPIVTGDTGFPTATLTVGNNAFTTYSYTTTTNHITNVSRWAGGTQTDPYKIDWWVYGPNNEIPTIMQMPLTDFPELDFANFSYYSTRLITQGDAYDIYTGRVFGDATTTSFNPVGEWLEVKP